jgi:hypothetical protein
MVITSRVNGKYTGWRIPDASLPTKWMVGTFSTAQGLPFVKSLVRSRDDVEIVAEN